MTPDYKTVKTSKVFNVRIGKRNAYHQAGQAAAVYLSNNRKKLRPVHFQITIKPFQQEDSFTGKSKHIPGKYGAKLEGGRLIADLPYCSYHIATRQLSTVERQFCQCAFEADVINLLAGSLAEAKYVALRDSEDFNVNLIYLGALKFYGGSRILGTINEYMECLFPDSKTDRKRKLTELFLAAYSFINDPAHWLAITRLAEAMLANPQELFSYEELTALLEPPIPVGAKVPNSGSLFNTSYWTQKPIRGCAIK